MLRFIKGLFYVIILFLYSCAKDQPANNIPIADFSYEDQIDQFQLINNSTDLDNDPLTYEWSCTSDLISLSNSSQKNNSFKLPVLTESAEVTIHLTVKDELDENTISKNITLPKFTRTREIGLGQEIVKEKSNNVDYEWYIDQMNSGTYWYENCGPSAVTMAIKWADESFNKTSEDARNNILPNGGWWYTYDIVNYLNKYSVSNKTVQFPNASVLIEEIDKNNIAILCLDIYYITYQRKSSWHVDKYYKTSKPESGHFIVVKGYKKVDNKVFFEIYDPWGVDARYSDNTLKGIDRYYRSEEILEATGIWWDKAIIVSRNPFTKSKGLDINKINHNYGF